MILSSRIYNYRGAPDWSESAGEDGAGWFDINSGDWKMRGVSMADCGDVNIMLPSEGNFDRMTGVVKSILARDVFPVAVGGDHSITGPVVRAFDRYNPLDIVQLDAHLDFSAPSEGIRFHNSSPIRCCSEYPFVRNITQIGISEYIRLNGGGMEAYDAAVSYGCNIITTRKFRQLGVNQVVDSIPRAENLYVTFDVDVLDAAFAPGTAARTPGGLSFREVQEVLNSIPSRGRVVGFDVNCYNPFFDPTGRTAKVVATLMLDFLAAAFPSKR
jgi:agmatinase